VRPLSRVVVTGVGLRCAAGDRPVVPDRAWVQADPAAAALGVDVIARRNSVPEDPRFADDRKGALAWAAAGDAAGDADERAGARVGVWMGTGLSSLTPDQLRRDLYPHLADGRFDRAATTRTG
jgi:hypothetical protein